MKSTKRKRLERSGWRLGDSAEFLGLSAEEQQLLELKMSLGRKLRENRTQQRWTQARLARMVQSSQSRVAKMESGDPSVSLDLLVKALLATGATRGDIARTIESEN
jgi:ribosome-binding protein aMBF1 (putative translation factor)